MEQQTTPKPFVFILMPFDTSFDDVYQLGIKAACHEAGGYSERVDEQNYNGSILERIYNQIAKADLIVADMTGRNPNVFYEVGYAHALGKSVVLLTQKAEDIPFDLKHYPHIIYGNSITQLKQDLQKRVKWAFDNPKGAAKLANEHIKVLANGADLSTAPTIECEFVKGYPYFTVVFDVHNSTQKTIETSQFQVGFLTDDTVDEFGAFVNRYMHTDNRYSTKSYEQSDKRMLHVVDKVFEVLPGSWEKIFGVYTRKGIADGQTFAAAVQIFSGKGIGEFPFAIKAVQAPEPPEEH